MRAACLAALALVTLAVLSFTWLRWMDPVVDFGRELYIPWRIVEGQHPVRDYIHLYGPFSVYFNAGLFALFGVGVHTIVWANLALFGVAAACLFAVTRRAFGFRPAVVAVAMVIPVFAFQHYTHLNNYTFAAPYSHEATHGMLFLLVTLVWLTRPARRAWTAFDGAVTGMLLALGCLTKSEYVLVAGILWLASVARAFAVASGRGRALRWMAASVAGGVGVWVATWLLLRLALGAADAARVASNALVAPFAFRALSSSTLGQTLLGVDHLAANLFRLVWVGAVAGALLAATGLAVHAAARRRSRAATVALLVGLALLAVAGAFLLPWRRCATIFPAVLVGGTVFLLWRRRATRGSTIGTRSWAQLVFALAAAGMLARMAFDPRVNHYGFFQAMLAGAWVFAFLVGEWPRVAAPDRRWRVLLAAAILVQFGAGVSWLWKRSSHYYRLKDFAMGQGADRMYSFQPGVHDLPRAWDKVREHLVATTPPDATLLVIPEGLSLNYWTRRRHPLWILDVLPATLTLNRGDLVAELKAAPPDRVVLVTRDMGEFGYEVYGQDERSGKALLEWVAAHYVVEGRAGDYPFTPGKSGLWLYRRK